MNKDVIYSLLKEHYKKYPLMQIQDLVKLLYQMEFGPGHMIEWEEKSLANLISEWNEVNKERSDSVSCIQTEEIGNGLVRVFLTSIEESMLPVLNKVFVDTANHFKGNIEDFQKNLQILREFCEGYYSDEERNTYLEDYRKEGYPAKGHSPTYRKTYAPSYRVILKSYVSYLELILNINQLLSKKESVTIAVDGDCASGKTELSALLSSYYDCNIIHMDDFFLPLELRTSKRMEEAGGNIHYERFREEIIENWNIAKPISYRRFSCKKMDYQGTVELSRKQLTIIEGSYSMREDFREIYDYTIFLCCSKETQIERIRKRNGEEMLRNFQEKWIPMEHKYFEEGNIKALCDEVITT